jgi:hypothetical protein
MNFPVKLCPTGAMILKKTFQGIFISKKRKLCENRIIADSA